MRAIYEKPEADIVDFRAIENLAVVRGSDVEEDVKDNDSGHVSRDF